MNPNDIFQIRSLLQSAASILVVLGQSRDVDVVAAGLGLYLTLNKANKQTDIVSPNQSRVELAYLIGIDKISQQIRGDNNLVVSLPYKEGAIERVSYNIANNKFNLVIEPRGEKINFDPQKIEYHYGSGSYDLIFVLGASDLQVLGPLYSQQAALFKQKPLINIDKNSRNNRYGRINLISRSSISQVVTFLIKGLNLPLDGDIASNLLTGVSAGMNGELNLEKAGPESLEAAAFLLRAGGRILKSNPPTFKKGKISEEKPKKEKKAPTDWLKPKIFTTEKGATLL